MSKRIDQLTAHPKSTAAPLSLSSDLVLRDDGLLSENTRKVTLGDVRLGGSVSITDFGADPTGVADSTAAIQAALDYIDTTFGGGILYCPQGTFKITQIQLRPGITLQGVGMGHIGAIGTRFNQATGVNTSAIVLDAATIAGNVAHYSQLKDFSLVKDAGADTLGSGIFINAATGEGFRIDHVYVEAFPEHGIRVGGAVPLYFSDIHLFDNNGYGLYVEGTHSVQCAQFILISGDNNASGLVGVYQSGNLNFIGIKAEHNTVSRQENVFVLDSTQGTPIYISNLSFQATLGFNSLVKVIGSEAEVFLSHITLSNGSSLPTYLVQDVFSGTNVPMFDLGGWRWPFMLFHCLGREVFRLDRDGMSGTIGRDPSPLASTFGIGVTTGIGDGAGTNLQAPAKGTGTGPATLTTNKWIRAYQGTTAGWIPFFT